MNPGGPLSACSDEPAGIGENVRDGQGMWEEIFSRQNLMIALKRVERNRGAAGVDGLGAEIFVPGVWCTGLRRGRRWTLVLMRRCRCVR